ncbi:AN1-type zinc finger protein 3 homolog isoform X1 [Myxocyprinus asiaticus]|uniref:AN1-type zinc finger protein 3 homolog isoform X1 n=2 Tax=Myxocyprinus asiaticus TaxID=70543 RepID=UPI0022229B54|nr:AN1-type zinc finger protein 3 homolog isoform X1 [Myxocyprinus asiaticus]
MGDTGSERSNPPTLPPRCPCGFWGSSKTMNLCSKCFTDFQKKQPDSECLSKPSSSSESTQLYSGEVSGVSSPDQTSHPEPPTVTDASLPFSTSQEGASCTDPAQGLLCIPTKQPCHSDDEASPVKRARLEDCSSGEEARSRPKQKNRKRCYRCSSKLELVQAALGSCRCGYVFCMRHRLPEQHECEFDHLGRGREEAVRNMVKLDRKVGRSCQRIGEECS